MQNSVEHVVSLQEVLEIVDFLHFIKYVKTFLFYSEYLNMGVN